MHLRGFDIFLDVGMWFIPKCSWDMLQTVEM